MAPQVLATYIHHNWIEHLSVAKSNIRSLLCLILPSPAAIYRDIHSRILLERIKNFPVAFLPNLCFSVTSISQRNLTIDKCYSSIHRYSNQCQEVAFSPRMFQFHLKSHGYTLKLYPTSNSAHTEWIRERRGTYTAAWGRRTEGSCIPAIVLWKSEIGEREQVSNDRDSIAAASESGSISAAFFLVVRCLALRLFCWILALGAWTATAATYPYHPRGIMVAHHGVRMDDTLLGMALGPPTWMKSSHLVINGAPLNWLLFSHYPIILMGYENMQLAWDSECLIHYGNEDSHAH